MKLRIFYKDFSKATKGVSHVGLGVTSQNTAEVLKQHRFDAEAVAVVSPEDIIARLKTEKDITHVVIGAAWVSVTKMEEMIKLHPHIKFCVVSHSNVGFLAIEPEAITLLKSYRDLQDKYHNFKVGGNCEKFVRAWNMMYETDLTILPNLYHTRIINRGPRPPRDIIKIGVFGAIRPLKNFVTAVGACLFIANTLGQDVEIHMSAGRDEGGATTIRAIDALVKDVPNVKLIKWAWSDHASFRTQVADMDILMQPSYTESFNMVSADGVTEGVPTIGSDAIYWLPNSWKAKVDDVADVAHVGIELLNNRDEKAREGLAALLKAVERGIGHWAKFINS